MDRSLRIAKKTLLVISYYLQNIKKSLYAASFSHDNASRSHENIKISLRVMKNSLQMIKYPL
jgi:hypothetical protein